MREERACAGAIGRHSRIAIGLATHAPKKVFDYVIVLSFRFNKSKDVILILNLQDVFFSMFAKTT